MCQSDEFVGILIITAGPVAKAIGAYQVFQIGTTMYRFLLSRPLVLILVLIFVTTLAACVAPIASPPETSSLSVALLPITDVVPFYVAAAEGYFDENGLDAIAVPVSSAAERDTIVQTGSADCELTDIHGVVVTNAADAQPLRIISTSRQATAEQPLFFLLSSPDSTIQEPAALAGANIAISENTVIDYWNDRILAASGIDPAIVIRTNVPQIPVRLELLLNNQVDAAILPDPLATLAQRQGAHWVVDDTVRPEIAVSVLACREDVIEEHPEAVAAFVSAWDRATEAINADPAAYSNILIENTRVPEPLQNEYVLPSFAQSAIPNEEQVQDVVDWAIEKDLIDAPLEYEQVVDVTFRE